MNRNKSTILNPKKVIFKESWEQYENKNILSHFKVNILTNVIIFIFFQVSPWICFIKVLPTQLNMKHTAFPCQDPRIIRLAPQWLCFMPVRLYAVWERVKISFIKS